MPLPLLDAGDGDAPSSLLLSSAASRFASEVPPTAGLVRFLGGACGGVLRGLPTPLPTPGPWAGAASALRWTVAGGADLRQRGCGG